ncbi:MAG: AAA family ATPase, partial [Desulfobacterales bacterium]
MYLKYYNLRLKPFEINPDPKFLWLGETHKEALAALKYGILDNKGFISLTGDVGTGKTTLVNALANSLGDNVIFAQITDPDLGQLDFINLTADALKMRQKFSTKGDFLSHLKVFLNDADAHDKDVVLLIEEAQRIDPERLEEVRLISNIEKPDKKLINIIFVGQNEFNSILNDNEALRQRIAIVHKLEPLQEIETEQYVTHRLKVAGSDQNIFSAEAIREIYTHTKGNPRLINIICDDALLTGYANDQTIIEPEIIRESVANCLSPKPQAEATAAELRTSTESTSETQTQYQPAEPQNSYQIVDQKTQKQPVGFKRSYLAPVFVVLLMGLLGYLYFFGDNHAAYRDLKTHLRQTVSRYIGADPDSSASQPDETVIQQSNVTGTQVQALALNSQGTPRKNQQAQLNSNNEELKATVAELKGAKERVAELEREVTMIDTMLSQSQLKVAKLSKEVKQERHKAEVLSSELASKVDLIDELQNKLENSQGNSLKTETIIENSDKKIKQLQNDLLNLKNENETLTADLEKLKGATDRVAELEEQLQALKTQKASSDSRLAEMTSRNESLTADLEKLKSATARVAELESAAAAREQTLSQTQQQVADLTVELDQAKKGAEQLSA